ncbi:hypothetical protein ACIRPT_15815 [Streptomyces sp. NPDC101227]|uniref:hypothetical protein n=1 Tax=Streptomyces sp. NPDC101227 TaxID=3366136 RepID=UPI0038305B13
MTPLTTATVHLAMDSSELAAHLLTDLVIKAVIVLAAVTVLALGMVMLWRRAGKGGDRGAGR